MELIQILRLQLIWLTTKQCTQKQISNHIWLTISTRIFC